MNTDKIYAESIAKEYAPKDNSKIIALRKLDKKAKTPATVFTYTFGVISALVLGTGMCFSMQVIGSGTLGMVIGIAVGVVGIIGCSGQRSGLCGFSRCGTTFRFRSFEPVVGKG